MNDNFVIGLTHYNEGNFKEAAFYFQQSLIKDETIAASYYADICYRNLDDGSHSVEEAAHWYLYAAYEGNDGDILSFLRSCSEELINETLSRQEKMQILVKWLTK